MLFIKEIFRFLAGGFTSRWQWLSVGIILPLLDIGAFAGIIWEIFLRSRMGMEPRILIVISAIYCTAVAYIGIMGFVAGKLKTVQTASLFYGSVGLYFLLSGYYGLDNREFSRWPWFVVWAVTLIIVLVNFSNEYAKNKEIPHDEG